MLCEGAVAQWSNHRILRCSSQWFLVEIPGIASVKVSITYMYSCPAIWVSHEKLKFKYEQIYINHNRYELQNRVRR